jgi:2-C-methyl-D-erythritol 4-phosphate cytidylyltransferase
MPSFAVIVVAAGKSERFADRHYKKPFAPLAGKAVWLYSAERFLQRKDVKQFLLVVSPEDREEFLQKFGANVAIMGVELVSGGSQRSDSVQNALAQVRPDIEYVAVHDAARPCLVDDWIDQVFDAAVRTGAAILANPVTGTLKRSRDGRAIDDTVSRESLWEAQTPQVFRRDLLLKAYAQRGQLQPTDDAQAVEQLGHPVALVPASRMNLKITTRDDLRWAEQTLKALPRPKLSGPAHPFADGDLWR